METKTQAVKNLLATQSHLTPTQIAREVGCHVTYVYEIRKGMDIKVKQARKAKN